MRDLENRAKPVWLSMVTGPCDRKALNADESHLLAVWSYKTALVINVCSNYRRIIPQSHYDHLFRTKDIPQGVFIDLASCPKSDELAWIQTQVVYGVQQGINPDLLAECMTSAYNIVVGLPRFLVRVIYLPLPGHTVSLNFGQADYARRLHPEPHGIDLDMKDSQNDCFEFSVADGFMPNSGAQYWET